MKAGLLLRVGIYLIGFWSLFTGVTNGFYYLHLFFFAGGNTPDYWQENPSEIATAYSSFVIPLLFAFCAFVFGDKIQRHLLGADGDAILASDAFAAHSLLVVACRILGLYLLAIAGAAAFATLYEQVTIASGHTYFDRRQVTSDMIYNLLAVLAGLVLVRKPEWVAGRPATTPPTDKIA